MGFLDLVCVKSKRKPGSDQNEEASILIFLSFSPKPGRSEKFRTSTAVSPGEMSGITEKLW